MIDPFSLYNKKYVEFINGRTTFIKEDILLETDKKKKVDSSKKYITRLNLFLLAIAVCFVVIFLKLFYLQIVRGEYYYQVADGNRIRIHSISANRGIIKDRSGKILADNTYNFILEAIPVDLPRVPEIRHELIDKISKITLQNVDEIRELMDKSISYSYEPFIIKDNLSYEQALNIRLLSSTYSGIFVSLGSRRVYTQTDYESLSHLLGYLGKMTDEELELYSTEYALADYRGKNGIELSYEKVLRGQKGKEQFEVDALGRKKEIIAYQDPVAGQNVILSLDFEIQKELESLVAKQMERIQKKRASAMVMNPKNGEIFALVSFPSFNNNDFSVGITQEKFKQLIENENQPLFHRAIQGTYPSGSTIKPLLAAAALQEQVVTKDTSFLSSGGIRINQWFFPDWKSGGHGYTNVTKALAESVNTYFYMIAGGYNSFNGLGYDRLINYYDSALLGKVLGLDLPGEAAGLLPTKEWKRQTKNELWYIGDTYHIAIGQGDILVTPLQVANWTAMIANGGTMFKPHVVLGVQKEGDNQVIIPFESEILIDQYVDHEHIQTVQEGLRQVITYGSGVRLFDLPIKIAGKTGTAQWSSTKENHAWFTSYAPYENPEIVLTILVEEGGEGSQVAVPIAYDFYLWWSQYRKQ